MDNLNFFSNYIEKKYHQKLYRIPIDLNLGCPNRIDKFGDGCIFCSEDGSKARHLQGIFAHNSCSEAEYLINQVATGKNYIAERYQNFGPYIAYFQSFTSTFAPLERLKKLYETTLNQAEFRVIIIGTRPDALNIELLEYLNALGKKYEIYLELGVQSSNNDTLKLINRGHDFDAVKKSMALIKKYPNVKTAAHIILGLSGESEEMMLQTARDIATLNFDAIKLHQLLLLKNTPLYQNFDKYKAITPLLNEYEYAKIAKKFIKLLPESTQIMRINADSDLENLVAPRWFMKKGQFREFFLRYFADNNSQESFLAIPTNDGSLTMYHPEFKQNFHSLVGAKSEAIEKFLLPSEFHSKLAKNDLHILDIGFGLGVNAFSAALEAEKLGKKHLFIDSLELDQRVLVAARNIYEQDSVELKMLNDLLEYGVTCGDFFTLKIYIDDARNSIKKLENKYDIIFQDGFSPDCNMELWSYDFIKKLSQYLKNDGVICSYSASFAYRGALIRAKLKIGETPAVGRKKGGTISGFNLSSQQQNLSQKELNIILKSTAGLAYRDINLNSSRKKIVEQRKKLFDLLRAKGIPKWYTEN